MKLKDIFSIRNLRTETNTIAGKILVLFKKEYEIPFSDKTITAINDDKISLLNKQKTFNDYISIACIAKNEGPYLREWLEYHRLIGVQRFYFYDNESTDNTKEILKPYIDKNIVIYHYVKGKCMQHPCYRDAFFRYKNNTRWMAIIDLDEFIVPTTNNDLKSLLKEYEKYPALAVNWLMFDSNGFIDPPENKLVTEAYTRISKEPDKWASNLYVKSIVDPKQVCYANNPHCFLYKNFQVAVTENFKKISHRPYHFSREYSIEKIRINHYYTKSLKEYEKRIQKGYPDMLAQKKFAASHLNFSETKHDYTIARFIPELKKRLESKII